METSIAHYIISIFKHYLPIILSWGFNTPIALPQGLKFKVQGYLHKGWVEVVYDEGYDTFTVRTLNGDGSIKRKVSDVYLDCLVSVIDGMVERCEGYAQKVKADYGLNG